MAQAHNPGTGKGTHREPWAAHAKHWSRLGPPLRPAPEDLERVRAAWGSSLPQGVPARRLDVVLLGVTPEYALFPWAPDFFLTAVDASEIMLKAVWPGDATNRKGLLGDWLGLPFPSASQDLILSDNGPAVLVGFAQLEALGWELHRVLRPAGRAVMRLMTRPAQAESPAALVQATASGSIRNFHELKLRLLMALQGEHADAGVRLGDTWDCFSRLFSDRQALASLLGCSLETIATIDVYRQSDARYSFYSLAEMERAFGDFHLAMGPPGRYPLAERCPVFSLTPKS